MPDNELSIHSSSSEDAPLPRPAIAPESAAVLIAGAFPDVDAASVRHLGSGTLFDAFRTADDWVFRFPRMWWAGTLFESEARTHDFVAAILPEHIRLPRVQHLAEPSERFPYRFAGHEFVPGVALDTLDESLIPTAAREIAEFLGALHSVPEKLAAAAGFREVTGADPGRQEWFNHGMKVSLEMRGLDPVVREAVDWLHTPPVTPPPLAERRLVHTSLDPEHLLFDPATGALIGVLDWTDVCLGPAGRDFVNLVAWRGWRFAEEVLSFYPRRVDSEFRTRLRWMSQWLTVIWLAHAPNLGLDIQKHIGAVHNAFGPNPNEALSPV